MIGNLVVGNINCKDYGVFVSDAGIYASPEPDYTSYEIAGRNGDLHINNGRYKNVDITYQAFIAHEFEDRFVPFRSAILSQDGYVRIEDDFKQDMYRLGRLKSGIEGKIKLARGIGTFELEFDCKPQWYLKSGEQDTVFTENGSILNPTVFPSKPLIRVYGKGTVTVGTNVFVINTAGTEFIEIDTDSKQAYEGTANRNSNIKVNQWGSLTSGNNTITLGTGITKVTVKPRWYEL
jgi:phage-related protein